MKPASTSTASSSENPRTYLNHDTDKPPGGVPLKRTGGASGRIVAHQYKLGDLLTVPQLAAMLSAAEKTIRDWVYKRRIPFTKLGGRIYFSKEQIEGLLADGARAPLTTKRPAGLRDRKEDRR